MKESKIFSERNLTEIVHYVYCVIIDGKYYIGKRTGLLNDLHTGRYKTSSKLVHEKLQNGFHFTKIKILKVFSTEKEAFEYEEKYLTRVDARRNPKFLNQHNGGNGNYTLKQHTEKSKKKMSKTKKALFDKNTEEGRKNREKVSKSQKTRFDINTEEGRKNRENVSKKQKERYNPDTEEGRKQREIRSEKVKSQFDPNTEAGRKRREHQSNKRKEYFNPETERGRQNLEKRSQISKSIFDINTEQGKKLRENHSKKMKDYYNTEEGKRNKEKRSESAKARFDPNTEEGRKRREIYSKNIKKVAETKLKKRIEASILGELMFDEAFIRQNFLITDDKNNQRFLSSVYSKLSGYCDGSIVKQKREGKLSFLYGIKSIYISEEQENAKIKEIEAIIKSMNKKKNN